MLQTHCICRGVLFFRLSPTSNQLWFGTVGSLCSASRLSESQLSPRKDGLSRSGLNILTMGVSMEKFPFQLLSCTESAGIKLPTLTEYCEASLTGMWKGKRESAVESLPHSSESRECAACGVQLVLHPQAGRDSQQSFPWPAGHFQDGCLARKASCVLQRGHGDMLWVRMPGAGEAAGHSQGRAGRAQGLLRALGSCGNTELTTSPSSLVQLLLQHRADTWQSGWKNYSTNPCAVWSQ